MDCHYKKEIILTYYILYDVQYNWITIEYKSHVILDSNLGE